MMVKYNEVGVGRYHLKSANFLNHGISSLGGAISSISPRLPVCNSHISSFLFEFLFFALYSALLL